MYVYVCMYLQFIFQLGPWVAVEIPDLIQKGFVKHKDSVQKDDDNDQMLN